MVSDGSGNFPFKEINDIKNSKNFNHKKLKFSAIGYGKDNNFEILEKISSELGG